MLDMTGLLRKSFMLMDKKILLFLALSAAGYPLCSQAQSQFKLQTQEIKNADNEPAPVFPVPSDRQLKWNETEFYAFYHYGMNTYTDKEWGGVENRKASSLRQLSPIRASGSKQPKRLA